MRITNEKMKSVTNEKMKSENEYEGNENGKKCERRI